MAMTPLIPLMIITFFMAYTTSSRHIFGPVCDGGTTNNTVNGTRTIGDCWTAIYDVKTCGNEIASYFKNGTIDIGDSCCHAIKTVTRDCWPNLLSLVGITIEERNILRGYCDAAGESSLSPVTNPVFQEPVSVNSVNVTTV
ncbi:hypothetical protein QVD17_07150 [Tagetes erecta]|uniref:Prolamin-like domain-containing protein n=1 Tax=Tagetes erecta TaxID=13708 RepID=A0AAD8PBW6_TARER|nr:hypothetical protein QVD17_07150 [Tagetes erecta]